MGHDTHLFQQFTPLPLSNASLVDPMINVTRSGNLTFTLSAQGGVAPFTWLDHPSGTVGVFVDYATGKPSNGFYLVPGQDRKGKLLTKRDTLLNFLKVLCSSIPDE